MTNFPSHRCIRQDPKKGWGTRKDLPASLIFSCSWKFYFLKVDAIIFRIPMQNVSSYIIVFPGLNDSQGTG